MDITGTIRVYTGTAAASPATRINFADPRTGRSTFARMVKVKNLGGSVTLLVTVPGSTAVVTLAVSGGSEIFYGTIGSIDIAAASATTTYEVIATLAC